MRRLLWIMTIAATMASGCASSTSPSTTTPGSLTTLSPVTTPAPDTTMGTTTTRPTTTVAPTTLAPTTTLPPGVTEPPDWLRQRPLPLRPDGIGEIEPTPPELVDRRFTSPDLLPPPTDDVFSSTIAPVPDDVLARSTWDPACPVTENELHYVTVTFLGFDGKPHTGELLAAETAAEPLVEVFEKLYAADFPIEEMRITSQADLDAAPTGDGNVTSAFSCRPVVGATHWSQHAYGLAIDINPFQNPYTRDDIVIPELASAYVDRSDLRPGMIVAGDAVTAAFDDIGWEWGGTWNRPIDIMHFSATGG